MNRKQNTLLERLQSSEGSEFQLRPVSYYVRLLKRLGSNEDTIPKIIGKQLILHASNYHEMINPDRNAKAINDEGIYLLSGFQELYKELERAENIQDYERGMLQPPELQGIMEESSASMFWHSITDIIQRHPSYLSSNDWFYDLGQKIDKAIGSAPHQTIGQALIDPYLERKFSNQASFQLRSEMRKIDHALEEYAAQ